MPIKVEDVMVKNVITIETKATVKEAVELMNKHEIGCLIAMENGKPVGIATERDMLNRVLLEAKNPVKTKVGEIMSKPLVVGKPQMEIEEAVKFMFEKNIKKLPIMENGKPLGLVTLTDLARSRKIIKILKELPTEKTPKRMTKVVDYFNRIIAVSH